MRMEILFDAIKRGQEVIGGMVMAKGEIISDFIFLDNETIDRVINREGFASIIETDFGKMSLFINDEGAIGFASQVVGLSPEEVKVEEVKDLLNEFFSQFFSIITLELSKISKGYSIKNKEFYEKITVAKLVEMGLTNIINLKMVAGEVDFDALFLLDNDLKRSLEEDYTVKREIEPVFSDIRADVPKHESKIEQTKLELILDLELPLYVRLGRTKMKIKDILKLAPGSIIELDKSAEDYVELVVNKKVVALGDVVVIESNFGFRIKEIVSRYERISGLKG
ncbi:MAG: FliM/FliN family flagellar motor switch protein [Thermosulfidibacteraceae bacterium]|jgi:flagellar motor switch protein FliN